ncbi:MAG: MBL fold metallo-hydrolase [Gemmatimonadetes bacterium]|uniref:MBL fold metallo-hydrolase n=1 Tax=Candidatus Kutchimonas denitrificans TaxID=3056748 RepID=A0AAE4ZC01_9BACT|nr:MBL fold metallo-hydrolase [Gemmatimonadota bacterium]NIR76236.1 MBL fold metallo-hydrolase [Candidatus Kutchimonas denitrificans]NIS00676.1 MBL fold metallo-hydrolase [Gemmatimonadota bacterium]NIT66821.1 MBL fold metallo-hydrolase [Gemmatimonadota bacterium]NIV23420.1 MBL fold metallo-hydrolase [Gemmatimonadota bacterium]
MSFRVHVLGSGSRGNSILLDTSETRILVDAGFSGRAIERRLAALEIPTDTIAALVITHEHRDHTQGMGIFSRRWKIPIHIAGATARSCAGLLSGAEEIHHYDVKRPFELGDLRIEPFLTCHDAIDPIGVTIRQRGSGLKVGVATDLGTPTVSVRHALRLCHLLILEANHDELMLREGPYPWSVKARIAGRHGHLSNRASAQLGLELMHEGLAGIVLAHLSQECNDPELAAEAVGTELRKKGYEGPLKVALQDEPLADLDVGALAAAVRTPQLGLFSEL